MFEDLSEYDWVIGLLTDSANYPNRVDIADLTGERSELVRRVNDLIDAIIEKEKATIAAPAGKYKKRNMNIGFSEESRTLTQLWSELTCSNTPAKLKAALPGLEVALLKAMVIGRDLGREGLELKYLEIKPLADIGKKSKDGGDKGRETTSREHKVKCQQWQAWVDSVAQKHPDWRFADIKRQVLKDHPAEVSASQLKRYTKKPNKK